MPLTLDWLLGRADLDLRLIGDDDPAGVVIEWVHSIELPDPSPWLAGGELVLTTGLRLPRARAEQAAYAQRLSDAGVAALAFGTGVRFETIPPALQEACATLGLPLVEVPLPTPFVAVTQAIAARIAELQYESVERSVRFQRRLTAAALHNGVRGVVQGLHGELETGVLLLDEHRREVEMVGAESGLTDRVRAELDRHTDTRRAALRVVDDDGRATEMQSLGGRTGSHGWLAIDADEPLSPTERLLLNQAASLLIMLQDRPVELLDLKRRLGTVVLDLLLDPADGEPASAQLYGFGFEPDDDLRVLACVRVSETVADLLLGGLDLLDEPWVATTNAGVPLCVLIRATDVTRFADHLTERLVGTEAREATVGVSEPLIPARVPSGLSAATYAAESARWRRERVGHCGDMTLAGLLTDQDVRERVDVLAAPAIVRLRDHPVLVESLGVYLRTNGSWETASRMLGVHRHTLRNRMAKVEELTELSLDVAENRVVLLLGLICQG